MNETKYFNLKKPSPEDFYDVKDFNDNFDIIDTEIKSAQEKADEAFQSASNGKETIKNAITGVDPTVEIPNQATFQQLANAIGQIETGVDTTDATATAGQILEDKTAYVKGNKVIGTMPNNTFATGSAYITPNSIKTDNLGNLCVAPKPGYYDAAANANGFGKIMLSDPDFVPANIKSGVNVFGVTGTASGIESIRGVVKEYYAYAGQNILAGDFVKYLTGVAGLGTGNFTTSNFQAGIGIMDTCVIDDTRIAMIIAVGTSNPIQVQLVVFRLNGVDLTMGAPILLSSSSSTAGRSHAVDYNGNQLLVANKDNGSTNTVVRSYDISNLTLALVATREISFDTNNSMIQKVIAVSSSLFLVCLQPVKVYGNYQGHILSYSITSTTITYLTNYSTQAVSSSSYYVKDYVLSEDKKCIFAPYSHFNGSNLTISRWSINGTALTYLNSFHISLATLDTVDAAEMRITVIDENRYIIINLENNQHTIIATLFSASSRLYSISVGTADSDIYYNRIGTFLTKVGLNKYILFHVPTGNISSTSTVQLRVLNVVGNTLTLNTARNFTVNTNYGLTGIMQNLNSVPAKSALLVGQKVLFTLSSGVGSHQAKYLIVNAPSDSIDSYNYLYETQIAKALYNPEIEGVAHTNATGGQNTGVAAGHHQKTKVTSITLPN